MPPARKAMTGYRRAFVVFSLAGLATLSMASSEVHARGSQRPRATAAAARHLADIRTKLESNDPAKVQAGLALALESRHHASSLVPLIEKLLQEGTSLEVARAALQTLGELGGPSSSSILRPYARHRRPELRLSAISALTKTGGLEAVFTLRRALGDSDADVRRAAALGLGALGAKEALDELALSLDRGLREAAPAIAKICPSSHCEKLLGKLEGLPFDIMADVTEALLFRPDSEDAHKLAVVIRLRDFGSQANARLRDISSRLKEASPEIRQALTADIEATASEEPSEAP